MNDMEKFEELSNVSEEDVPVPENKKAIVPEEETRSNSKNWAKEGELRQAGNEEGGVKRCIEALDKVKEEALSTFE